MRIHPSFRPFMFILMFAALLTVSSLFAQDDLDGGLDLGGDPLEENLMNELEAEKRPKDLELLKISNLSQLLYWNGVKRTLRRRRRNDASPEKPKPMGWQEAKRLSDELVPIKGKSIPMTALFAIPEDGKYRVWLRRIADSVRPHPVLLKLIGANQVEHVYGKFKLTSEASKKQEKKLPVRFEDEAVKMAFPSGSSWVWEYWDVPLKKGTTEFAISTKDPRAKLSTLFMTKSKAFVPSFAKGQYNNLNRVYYRIRAKNATPPCRTYAIPGVGLTYHWRFIPKGMKEPLWYSSLNRLGLKQGNEAITGANGKPTIQMGKWGSWIDATWSGTGGGPWATGFITFRGINKGQGEVEIAWYPHPGAVLKTIAPKIAKSRAAFMVPLNRAVVPLIKPDPEGKTPVWGMFDQPYLDLLESASDVHKRQLEWGKEAIAQLGLKEDHPACRSFHLITGCGVAPAAVEDAARMLAKIGINAIDGLPPDLCKEFNTTPWRRLAYSDWGYLSDTHDPADPAAMSAIRRNLEKRADQGGKDNPNFRKIVRTIKLGDEIGAIASSSKINASADCRRKFHDYLRQVLKDEKTDAKTFFGVENIEDLECVDDLPENPGIFERRLYYHSQIFKFVLTADYYRQVTTASKEIFPNSYTYANFSPHPIVLGGQTMNHAEWFSLSRRGGASMAWGEDWASRGGTWGYHGIEVVSYYGAWVECAARKNGGPAGFYNVGAGDNENISLASRNVRYIRQYSFGPRYAGAEASNFWSDNKHAYETIVKSSRVLGPADDILADTRPEKRQVALLYNRPYEIMNGGTHFVQANRALTFAALANAHHNANIILADDLTPEILKEYKVIYLNGFNLPKQSIPVLQKWVENGGILVASAGTGQFDIYNDPLQEAIPLFGATQEFVGKSIGSPHPVRLHSHKPIDKVTVKQTDLTPAVAADLIGCKFILTPTTGKPIATYSDGTCAGVLNKLGKGNVILWGFQPGILYKGDVPNTSAYRHDRLDLVVKPAKIAIGSPSVDCTAKQIEMTRFENNKGIAVLLNNFAFRDWKEGMPPVKMTVRTKRQVKSVMSSLKGPLKWKKNGNLVEIELPVPYSIDAVVLR